MTFHLEKGHSFGAGVKAADAILKKHPEHGETLCMKAGGIVMELDLLDVAQNIPRLTS